MSRVGRRRASGPSRKGGPRWVGRGGPTLGLALAVVIAGGIALYLTRGSGSAGTGSPITGPAGSESLQGPIAVGTLPGRQAPDFAIETAEGQAVRLSSFRGRVVVLDFLAPG